MSLIELTNYFGSIFAFILAIGLLVRPLRFRNIILALFFMLIAYTTLFLNMVHSSKIYEYPFMLYINIPLEFFMGPLLYFYTSSLIEDKIKLSKKDFLHLIPGILTIPFIIPSLFLPIAEQKIQLENILLQKGDLLLQIFYYASPFIPVIYIIFSIAKIAISMRKKTSHQKKNILLLTLLSSWLIAGIVGIGGTIALSVPIMKFINLFISFFIFFFYLLSQRYPYLLQYGTIPTKKIKHSKSLLTKIDLENLNKELNSIMEGEKLFCDEDLNLSRLSQALNITPHQLSEFINNFYKQNFNSFINNFRINEAKKNFKEEPGRNTLSIALSVGFNSYSAFHSAFKKTTGVSPATYRKTLQK